MAESLENYVNYKKNCETEANEDFSSLTFSDISPTKKSIKQPKRILHFSDGTLEEYSTDEDENETAPDSASVIDAKSLPWGKWVIHKAAQTGKSVLATCDYVGEGIANFLGITSQRYFYEIEEYKRTMKQEEEEKKQTEAEMAGWSSDNQSSPNVQEPLFQNEIPVHFEKNDSSVQISEEIRKY